MVGKFFRENVRPRLMGKPIGEYQMLVSASAIGPAAPLGMVLRCEGYTSLLPSYEKEYLFVTADMLF